MMPSYFPLNDTGNTTNNNSSSNVRTHRQQQQKLLDRLCRDGDAVDEGSGGPTMMNKSTQRPMLHTAATYSLSDEENHHHHHHRLINIPPPPHPPSPPYLIKASLHHQSSPRDDNTRQAHPASAKTHHRQGITAGSSSGGSGSGHARQQQRNGLSSSSAITITTASSQRSSLSEEDETSAGSSNNTNTTTMSSGGGVLDLVVAMGSPRHRGTDVVGEGYEYHYRHDGSRRANSNSSIRSGHHHHHHDSSSRNQHITEDHRHHRLRPQVPRDRRVNSTPAAEETDENNARRAIRSVESRGEEKQQHYTDPYSSLPRRDHHSPYRQQTSSATAVGHGLSLQQKKEEERNHHNADHIPTTKQQHFGIVRRHRPHEDDQAQHSSAPVAPMRRPPLNVPQLGPTLTTIVTPPPTPTPSLRSVTVVTAAAPPMERPTTTTAAAAAARVLMMNTPLPMPMATGSSASTATNTCTTVSARSSSSLNRSRAISSSTPPAAVVAVAAASKPSSSSVQAAATSGSSSIRSGGIGGGGVVTRQHSSSSAAAPSSSTPVAASTSGAPPPLLSFTPFEIEEFRHVVAGPPPAAAATSSTGTRSNNSSSNSNSKQTSNSPPPTATVRHRFQSIEVIGRGTFATVHKMRHISSNTIVAGKFIDTAKMDDKCRSFLPREAGIAASCDHPNLVRFLERIEGRGQQQQQYGKVLLIFEYADFGELSKQIKSRITTIPQNNTDSKAAQQQQQQLDKRKTASSSPASSAAASYKYFSESEIILIFTQLCLAMNHMHHSDGRNYIHCDLKTSNVFLTSSGLVKIGDFGFAHSEGTYANEKVRDAPIGTSYWIAPERWVHAPYTKKADIWSLGVILFELMALRKPFTGANFDELIQNTVRGSLSAALPSHFSQPLRQVCMAMLSTDPRKRPSTRTILSQSVIREHGLVPLRQNAPLLTCVPIKVRRALVNDIESILGEEYVRRLLLSAAPLTYLPEESTRS